MYLAVVASTNYLNIIAAYMKSITVRCAMNKEDEEMNGSVMTKYKTREERRKHAIFRRKGGLNFLKNANYGYDGGAVPLAFRVKEYVEARHEEMVEMMTTDEKTRLQVAVLG